MSSFVLFSDQEIKGATNGLSDSSRIGQGGYGTVYKGSLRDTEVAIKMLDPNSQQGIDEFLQEMEVLGRMRHPNLVKLIGACVKLRALVYEFLPHGSLGDCLQKNPEILTWQIRTRIVYELCLALTFLHSIKPQPVVHGDLKPANILLDAHFISKLADFGLCRFIPEGTTSVAFLDTKPKGTFGYIDPEFMRTGILTPCCDVYSFGVTILRLLTGMDTLGIATKVRIAYKEKSLMTMVDPTAGQWPAYVSELLAYFGLKCCAKRKSPGLMKEIAEDLEKILADIDVDVVSTNMANNKLTAVGSVDPLKIREYVGSKTGKKVDIVSSQPTKKDDESSEPKKAQSESKDKKKADDKKPKPRAVSRYLEILGKTSKPASTTVVLKIRLHCDGCMIKIRRIILKFKGVESVNVDSQKELITVKGTMNMKKLVPYLKETLNRNVDIVAGEEEDGDGSEKKDNANADVDANANDNAGGEKKEKDGDGDKREKGKAGEGDDKKEAATEAKMMTNYYYPSRLPGRPGTPPETVHPPQMFSDENPNACSVM